MALSELFDNTVMIENGKTNFKRCYMDKDDIILEYNPELVIGNRWALSCISLLWKV